MANSGHEQSTFSGELYNLSFDSVEEDSNNVAWFSLIQNLANDKLESLKVMFKEKSDINGKEIGLNREEFLNNICYLYGNSKYSLQSIMLFDSITMGAGESTLRWNVFLDFLLQSICPKVEQKVLLSVNQIECVPHTKRETIVKIVSIETEKHFCYAIISKHGRIGLYDGNLNFLTSYHVIMTREDITRSEDERRRRNRWVTDAIFCDDVLMFIVTNTARSIMIYEASGLRHVPYWLVLSTPNIVECFAYKRHDNFNEKSDERHESMLFMADCYGGVISFKFLQPKHGFLRKKYNDKLSLFYWIELPFEKEYIIIKSHGRIHKNSIKQIKYCATSNSVFTCSRDSEASVVQRDILNKRKPYIFKMKRGASCFTICSTLKLLITGSEDGTIRIWNSVIVTNPIAVLLGHRNELCDMQILENQQMLISCSRDGVLKSWDIIEHKCLQSLKIKFPSFEIEGKYIEWVTKSIFAGPKRYTNSDMMGTDRSTKTCFNIENVSERKQRKLEEVSSLNLDSWERSNILVTCCNYIANIRLQFDDVNIEKIFEMQVLTPPPLQNSVLIPSSWRIQDKVIERAQSFSMEIPDDNNIENNFMEGLNFILDKDLLEEDLMKSNINQKISILEAKKLEMQKHVALGAPYVALDLSAITELKLSENLSIPNKRSIKSTVEKIEKILSDASTKDEAFSEPSSSRSKSSRSSLIEFPY